MKKKTTIKIDVKKPWELPKGHAPHKSGAGKHLDKRTKRNRTRGNQTKRAIEDGE